MRAIVYDRAGDSGVLQLVERPLPVPAHGEVRVRIVVSGVNPTDWKRREGGPIAEPTTPGQDGAGVVDALGEGVTGLAVGDRVWLFLAQAGRPTGTAAEYAVVPADRVVLLADDASFDLGASLGIPAMTAHRALTVAEGGPDRLGPGALAGRTVLVSGGAGAVGHAAIQLARWAGAAVISTVSSERKADLARRAGAQVTVDYRGDDPAGSIRAAAPDGVDLVVEVDVAANAALLQQVLAVRATVAAYADGGGPLQTSVRPFMQLNARLQFVLVYSMGEAALAAAVADVAAAVADGALPVGEAAGLPITRFGLADTAAAQDAVRDGAVGKVVIDVGA